MAEILHIFDCFPARGEFAGKKLELRGGYNHDDKKFFVAVYKFTERGDHLISPPLWRLPDGWDNLLNAREFISQHYAVNAPPGFWAAVKETENERSSKTIRVQWQTLTHSEEKGFYYV